MNKINLQDAMAQIKAPWTPKLVGEVNDTDVKLARLEGAFVWHRHPDADEMFLVLAGTLEMRFRDRCVTLHPGEMLIVPRGVEHLPVAAEPCAVMLVEPRGTLNTGDAPEEDRTVHRLERLTAQ